MDMPKGDFRTRRFAEVVRERALAAGYEMDSPRGGGRTALATDTGMSLASVSRMMSGQVIPDARFLAPLANALRMDVVAVFVLAGLLPEESMREPAQSPRPITAAEAAENLGITDPDKVSLFKAVVGNLLHGIEDRDPNSLPERRG